VFWGQCGPSIRKKNYAYPYAECYKLVTNYTTAAYKLYGSPPMRASQHVTATNINWAGAINDVQNRTFGFP